MSRKIPDQESPRTGKSGQKIPWDATFKAFFSHRIMVESLLKSFLMPEILTGLDWSSLEPWNSSHVSKALKQRFNDCIWRMQTARGPVYFYFMLEFQRTSDKLMPLRIAEYNSLLLQGLHKAKVIAEENHNPPVISVVIYMGEGNWTAPLSIKETRPDLSPELQKLQLQQEYILLNANSKSAGRQTTPAELLFTICDSKPDQVRPLMDKIEALLKGDEYDSLRQLFIEMINFAILQPAEIEPVDKTINFTEAKEMMTAKAQKWRQEVLNEGIIQGMAMPEAKAQKWRQEVLNEGIIQGMAMPEAKAKQWHEKVFNQGKEYAMKLNEANEQDGTSTMDAFRSVALEMLKAGEPRDRILKYTRLTEAELDKLAKNQ